MEPRARAGKNVGKMNFTANDLSLILYGFGDVRNPSQKPFACQPRRPPRRPPKIKAEDFSFAFRRNPSFLGKIQEVFEKKNEIESARKIFKETEDDIVKEAAATEAKGGKAGGAGGGAAGDAAADGEGGATAGSVAGGTTAETGRAAPAEEEALGEQDDDAEAEADVLRKR
ncbi:unnamed protein product [Parascedosporium putredinis]|uniref:Uncharacterized protein n=1 Tax=Parascedosporium putredinis TaxID=1442378 RepID=A0A9P1M7X1_9PEZI|nr:unnamed protein product [Parascedosporium putredinis]CAI7988771.1 unnamed protein product [Parascedosporium putredinis]